MKIEDMHIVRYGTAVASGCTTVGLQLQSIL